MLLVRNLLSDFDEIVALLRAQLVVAGDGDPDDVLDAFLLAAGASQILEDHLHRDLLGFGRAVQPFSRARRGGLARLAAGLERVGLASRSLRPRERTLRRASREIDALADRLAEAAAGTRELPPGLDLDLPGSLPESLGRSVVRLPNCFRSFDQHPDDCRTLTGILLRVLAAHDASRRGKLRHGLALALLFRRRR